MRCPGLSFCHVVLYLESVGGRHWRMPLLLSQPEPVPRSPAGILSAPPVLTSMGPGVPLRIYWPELYLDFLRWGRGFSSFRRKDKAKSFPESFSPLLLTRLLCPRWCVIEISTMIGLHVPLRNNSPEDISLRFRLLWWFSSPKSAYILSANCVCTRRPQCNPQYNMRPCTP